MHQLIKASVTQVLLVFLFKTDNKDLQKEPHHYKWPAELSIFCLRKDLRTNFIIMYKDHHGKKIFNILQDLEKKGLKRKKTELNTYKLDIGGKNLNTPHHFLIVEVIQFK